MWALMNNSILETLLCAAAISQCHARSMLDLPSWVPDWSVVFHMEGMDGIHSYANLIYISQKGDCLRNDKLKGDDLGLLGDFNLLHATDIKFLSHSRKQMMCNERVLTFWGKFGYSEYKYFELGIQLTAMANERFRISGLVKLSGINSDYPSVRDILRKTHRNSIPIV